MMLIVDQYQSLASPGRSTTDDYTGRTEEDYLSDIISKSHRVTNSTFQVLIDEHWSTFSPVVLVSILLGIGTIYVFLCLLMTV